MTSIAPSPTNLTADGGSLTVTAEVTGATSCDLADDQGSDLITNDPCPSGVSNVYSIPANSTDSPKTLTFTVTGHGAGGEDATGTLHDEPAGGHAGYSAGRQHRDLAIDD